MYITVGFQKITSTTLRGNTLKNTDNIILANINLVGLNKLKVLFSIADYKELYAITYH